MLGLELLVEEERKVQPRDGKGRQPGVVVGQAPQRHRADAVREPPILVEDVAVAVGLLHQDLLGYDLVARRGIGVDADVHLGDLVVQPEGGEGLDGRADGRYRGVLDVDVHLVADAVDGDAAGDHALHHAEERLPFGSLGGAVVVDAQLDRGPCDLPRNPEGAVDVVRSRELEPPAPAQSVRLAGVDHLVHDIPGRDHVGVARQDGSDVRLQPLQHQLLVLRRRREVDAAGVAEDPVGRLLVPDEGMPPHLQAVLSREVGDGVRRAEGVGGLGGMDRGELPGVFGRDRVEVLPHQVVVAGAGDPAHVDRPADREGAGEHVLERGDVGLDRHGGRVGQRHIVDVEGCGGGGGRLHFQGEEVGVPRHREQGRHPHPLTGGDGGVGDDRVEAGDAGEPPLDGGPQAGVRLAGRQLRPDRHPIAEAACHLAQDVQGGPLPDGRAPGRTKAARASVRLLGHIGEHRSAQRGPVPIAAILRGEAEAAAAAVRLEVAGETGLVGHHFRDAEVVDVVLRRGARAFHVQDQLGDVGGEPVAALERHPASAGMSHSLLKIEL